MMELYELYDKERTALREELYNLKHCQITFLTSSITATGLLLGIAATLASTPVLGIIFLFPLIVLFPAWWIFFDKATTITRIVGYYRILEGLILGYHESSNFIGWENALREFRAQQTQNALNPPKELVRPMHSILVSIILMRTGHRYWVISYFTFWALSALCVVASIVILQTAWFLVVPVPVVLFLISTVWNAWIVSQLINGRYSYECNEHFWKKILRITNVLPETK